MSEMEKHRAPRKQSDYVVEFYDLDGLLLAGVGHLLDLSATGALVESPLRLVAGQTLRIRLRRGDQSELELPATVVRVRGKGTQMTYGIKFIRD
jgi:hypothetical protein